MPGQYQGPPPPNEPFRIPPPPPGQGNPPASSANLPPGHPPAPPPGPPTPPMGLPAGMPQGSNPADLIQQAQLTAPPAGMHPVNATFANGTVRYLGYLMQPEPALLGQPFVLTHFWKVEKPVLGGDWQIFVHLGLPNPPGAFLNADHTAIQGAYPTSQWKAGTLFRDDQLLRLPPDLQTNELQLYVGLYQGDTRMVLDQRDKGQDNRLFVGNLHLAGAGAAGAASSAGTDGPPLPTYKVPRAKGPIKIDGVLDEADWKHAPMVVLGRSIDGGPTKYRTEARLLWDDQFLYVSFVSQDEDVWSDFTKHDDKIYTQEAVEIFIDADGDGKTYNELEIAPTNATFDAYFPARREGMDLSWESGMVSAVKVDGTLNNPNDVDKSWTAEARIPIAKLAAVPHVPPRVGDKWRFNLYRLDWHTGRKINEGSAFSPLLVGDFHNLPRFGWLEFVK
jgi:hypothetical protein